MEEDKLIEDLDVDFISGIFNFYLNIFKLYNIN